RRVSLTGWKPVSDATLYGRTDLISDRTADGRPVVRRREQRADLDRGRRAPAVHRRRRLPRVGHPAAPRRVLLPPGGRGAQPRDDDGPVPARRERGGTHP